jgi:DNA-binding transcriptional regulator GbsR (MarR family)
LAQAITTIMKFPMTADEVEHEILLSSDKFKELGDLRIRQFIKILPKANHEIVAEGVIRVFERGGGTDKYSQEQEFAGKVLEIIKPKSRKEIKEVLLRVLKNWDKSVEQFPFWLRDNYGIEKLKETFAQLELTETEMDKLKTIKWWLHLNEDNT